MRWLLIFVLLVSFVVADNLTDQNNDTFNFNDGTGLFDLNNQINESGNACGDGIIQIGEGCQNCPEDVKCNSDEKCIINKCVYEKKERNFTLIIFVIGGILLITAIVAFYFYKKEKKEIKNIENQSKEFKEIETKKEFYQVAPKKQVDIEPDKTKKIAKDKLYRFIEHQCKKGVKGEIIRDKLINKGWDKKTVNERINQIYDAEKGV